MSGTIPPRSRLRETRWCDDHQVRSRPRQAHVELVEALACPPAARTSTMTSRSRPLKRRMVSKSTHVVRLLGHLLRRQPLESSLVVEGLVPEHGVPVAAVRATPRCRSPTRPTSTAIWNVGTCSSTTAGAASCAAPLDGPSTRRRLNDLRRQPLLAQSPRVGSHGVPAEARGQRRDGRGGLRWSSVQLQPLKPQPCHDIGPEERLRGSWKTQKTPVVLIEQ